MVDLVDTNTGKPIEREAIYPAIAGILFTTAESSILLPDKQFASTVNPISVAEFGMDK